MKTISSYYINKYGVPRRQAEFLSPEAEKIEIYKWDENQTKEGVAIYATLGASDLLGDESHGCEFFIGLQPEVDDIVEALAEVALHGTGNYEIPATGDSITLAFNLWKGTNAKSFLYTDGEEIMPSTHVAGKKITFIQLVPLFPSELAYKKNKGEEKLWSTFEARQVPYWSSKRTSAI